MRRAAMRKLRLVAVAPHQRRTADGRARRPACASQVQHLCATSSGEGCRGRSAELTVGDRGTVEASNETDCCFLARRCGRRRDVPRRRGCGRRQPTRRHQEEGHAHRRREDRLSAVGHARSRAATSSAWSRTWPPTSPSGSASSSSSCRSCPRTGCSSCSRARST